MQEHVCKFWVAISIISHTLTYISNDIVKVYNTIKSTINYDIFIINLLITGKNYNKNKNIDQFEKNNNNIVLIIIC